MISSSLISTPNFEAHVSDSLNSQLCECGLDNIYKYYFNKIEDSSFIPLKGKFMISYRKPAPSPSYFANLEKANGSCSNENEYIDSTNFGSLQTNLIASEPTTISSFDEERLFIDLNYIASIELIISGIGNKTPDPRFDPISLIACTIKEKNSTTFLFTLKKFNILSSKKFKIIETCCEYSMLSKFSEQLCYIDPDYLLGYDLQKYSIGYLIDRYAVIACIGSSCNFCPGLKSSGRISKSREEYRLSLSRFLSSDSIRSNGDHCSDSYGAGVSIDGRILLNLWRLMKNDVNLMSYTFENLVFSILKKRKPCYHSYKVGEWLNSGDFRIIDCSINYIN